jgi:uncharacterized protein
MGGTENFEWHDGKDASNFAKHGIPLRFGIFLFDDPYLLRAAPRKMSDGELRQIAIGQIGNRVLTCVYTFRGAKRRLISLRIARRSERRVYEGQIHKGTD